MTSPNVYGFSTLFRLLGLLVVCASASVANAALVTTTYGDFIGTQRDYINVLEASVFGDPGPFGTPHIDLVNAPNTLLFENMNDFRAEALGPGFGINSLDSRLRFTVDAHAGSIIDTILFEETGIVSLGLLGGEEQEPGMAQAMVGLQIFYRITEVDYLPFAGATTPTPPVVFSPKKSFSTIDDGSLDNQVWQGSLLLDLNALNPNLAGRITAVEIILDNSVTAMNTPGATASIEKTRLKITVPEVSAPILGVLAVLGLAVVRVRRFRTAKL